jgi:mRNA interferase YafQ
MGKRVLEILDLLENDPFTPSLKSHKLTGDLNAYWSCSVNYNCRVIFTFSQDEESEEPLLILVDIGSHSGSLLAQI